MQNAFPEPSPLNIDNFFSSIGNIFKYIFSVHFLQFMYVFGTIVVILLITLILYLFVRMYEVRQEDKRLKPAAALLTAIPTATGGSVSVQTHPENSTYADVREKLLSDSASDWKLAVIEADIYLDRVLDDKGFHGDTTSDKLKQVSPDKLPSVQIAWEAHKVRNRIAHEGAAFVLTKPEARRLLSYYEIVFTDLGVI